MNAKLALIKQFLQVLHRSGVQGKVCLWLCVLALVYFILPFDFIPDMAFGAGQLDDFFVLVSSLLLAFNTYRKNAPNANGEDDKSVSREDDESIDC